MVWNVARSILLVENHPDLLENFSLTLEMSGYHTIRARDHIEALAALRSRSIDLILLDVDMSIMGSYQFGGQVHSNPHWANIPFLFLIGCRFLSDTEIRIGKSLGVREYLSKPVRAKDLLEVIERVLQPDKPAVCTAYPGLNP